MDSFLRRSGHEVAVVGDSLFVFGGENLDGSSSTDPVPVLLPRHIVARFDFVSGEWTELKTRPVAGSTLPSPCRDARTAVIQDVVYSFGGLGEEGTRLNSLYAFNSKQNTWRRLATEPTRLRPSRRSACGLTAIANSLVMFGGFGPQPLQLQSGAEWITAPYQESSDGWNNELFVFDTETGRWNFIDVTGRRPSSCSDHSFTAVDEFSIVMFGGHCGIESHAALHVLHLRARPQSEDYKGWWDFVAQQVPGDMLVWPTPRYSHSAIPIPSPSGPVLLILGGLGERDLACPDDAYFWDVKASCWYRIKEHGLPLRFWKRASGIYKSTGDKVIIFCLGGEGRDFSGHRKCGKFVKFRWDESNMLYLFLEVQRLRFLLTTSRHSPAEQRKPLGDAAEIVELRHQVERLQKASEETEQRLSIQIGTFLVDQDEVEASGEELGRGSYGAVHVGWWRGVKVAVKSFHGLLYSNHLRRLWDQELLVCARLRHPNVVSYFGAVVVDGTPLQIVMELLEGSLSELITAATKSGQYKLRKMEMVDLAYGCTAGVAYLHDLRPHPCIHCDIRPTNVMVARDMTAKLGDFGASHLLESSLSVGPVSFNYSAPERTGAGGSVVGRSSIETDVYSLGVTICEVFTGEAAVREGRMQQIAKVDDRELADICTHMVDMVPEKRPLVSDVRTRLGCFRESFDLKGLSSRLVIRRKGDRGRVTLSLVET